MYVSILLAIKRITRSTSTNDSTLIMSSPPSTPFIDAISSNNLSTLRGLLETQDHALFTTVAKCGTPEIADYLLPRHSVEEDHTQVIKDPHPTSNPLSFLFRESAYTGNAPLFRHLLFEYPSLFSSNTTNNEAVLRKAIRGGGVPIWKILLEQSPFWKDHEFAGHNGVVIEKVAQEGSLELLQYLLEQGAELEGCGDDVLRIATRSWRLDQERLDLIGKYCKLQGLKT